MYHGWGGTTASCLCLNNANKALLKAGILIAYKTGFTREFA